MVARDSAPLSLFTNPTGFYEGSRSTQEGIVISTTPDICLTPVGNQMVPVAYNIWAKQSNEANTVPDVKLTGLRAHNMGSLITTCHGDEAGGGGGVKSGTHNGICEPKGHSRNVRAGGMPMIRHTDEWWMNNRNTVGRLQYVKNPNFYDRWSGNLAQRALLADSGAIMSDAPVAARLAPAAQAAETAALEAAVQATERAAAQKALEAAIAATERQAAAAAARAAAADATMVLAGEEGGAAVATSETGVGAIVFGVLAIGTAAYGGYETWRAYKEMREAQEKLDKLKKDLEKTKADAKPKEETDTGVVRVTDDEQQRKEKCKCVVGTYAQIRNICGPLCGMQAHHIVPDYTLRYGNRSEGEKGIKRIPGMPSFSGGAAICLEGNARDRSTEHGEAHGADAEIAALGSGSSYYPVGTAPIKNIKQAALAQVMAVKSDPACSAAIQSAVASSFTGVNDALLGRTTADRWPAQGTEAYDALSRGMTATQH